MKGFVYAIGGDDGRVKIGWSADPLRRLAKIKCDCSQPVGLLGLVSATKQQEAETHALLDRWRLPGRREWFRYEGAVIAFVNMLSQPVPRSMKDNPLKAYRQREGITQGQLADQLDVDRVTIARWETGARQVARKNLRAISLKTGIHPKDLRPDLVKLLGLD